MPRRRVGWIGSDRLVDEAALVRGLFGAAGVRSVVACQWTPTPLDQGRSWDTAIMGDGLTETPESAQLPTLRC